MSRILGVKMPTRSTSWARPVDMTSSFWRGLRLPFMTRTSETTPTKLSNQESMMSACSGPSGSPLGGGMRLTSSSSRSGTPKPVLALTRTASMASMPMISSTSSATLSGSALGRSILFSTGITSRPWSSAV